MQFPNSTPTPENLTQFASMLLSECEVVTLYFLNEVLPTQSQGSGYAIFAGPNSDTSNIDHTRLDHQVICDINRRTLPLVASQAAKFIVQGFEPWFWIAEQLNDRPRSHFMAGVFDPKYKDSVAEMLRETLPAWAVRVEG